MSGTRRTPLSPLKSKSASSSTSAPISEPISEPVSEPVSASASASASPFTNKSEGTPQASSGASININLNATTNNKVTTSPSTNSGSNTKIKRSKTFTGCFTCRSRKIRCDLTKPYCKNCTKARLLCAGYDIKLRWSLPIQFSSKTGNTISSLVVFNNINRQSQNDEDNDNSSEFFQRRHVGFVKWNAKKNCKPYETYDEIDKDLSLVHNSSNNESIVFEGKTKFVGPFGIFQGSRNINDSISKLTNKNQSKKRLKTFNDQDSKAVPEKKTKYQPFPISKTDETDVSTAHDQLWLSNELRDDALLTAAALNGDSQFLEFMNNFSNTNSNITNLSTNSTNSQTPIINDLTNQNFTNLNTTTNNPTNTTNSNKTAISNNQNYNQNQNDFLNLVFHRNTGLSSQQQPSVVDTIPNLADQQPQQQQQSQQQQQQMSQQQLQQQQLQKNVPIDSTNQHLYYSNYNTYYYNNPYQLSENLEIHLHASKLSQNNQEEEGTDIVEGDNSNTTTMPDSIMSIIQSPLQPKLGFDVSLPIVKSDVIDNRMMGLPTTALQVQPLARYLLNYYITQVADLMTVIPLTENPWKTIYFPRALMAIGELSALGSTSIAKNALLNALLAVSAFNLQSKFPKNSDPMKYYLNLGIRLRNQASLFVRKLLGSNTDTQSGIEFCINNEKYKDVLCAVMTMISVDLVWGTMQDTNFYIKWCGRVIVTKMLNKKKLSSKARILHRIFSSLKLIQDSTCLDFQNIKDNFDLNEIDYDVNGKKFDKFQYPSDSKNKIDYIVNGGTGTGNNNNNNSNGSDRINKDTSPLFLDKKLINTKKNDENFATDALYGLPNSLIVLFSETVQLLRTKIYYEELSESLPNNFEKRVEDLNSKLANWKLDWKLYEDSHDSQESQESDLQNLQDLDKDKKFFSTMHEVTYHHILSFYHALTIYFNRLIKEIPSIEVQNKVEKTLKHLNSIQQLIAKGEAAIIPLFWQGFIAGCEALSTTLQMGFKKWGADIAQYLGSYWGARQIMLEVWRRKRMKETRDDWVSVISDWEMNLMLN